MIVAGGGAGGSHYIGTGGGAGGLIYNTSLMFNGTYTIQVGRGGVFFLKQMKKMDYHLK